MGCAAVMPGDSTLGFRIGVVGCGAAGRRPELRTRPRALVFAVLAIAACTAVARAASRAASDWGEMGEEEWGGSRARTVVLAVPRGTCRALHRAAGSAEAHARSTCRRAVRSTLQGAWRGQQATPARIYAAKHRNGRADAALLAYDLPSPSPPLSARPCAGLTKKTQGEDLSTNFKFNLPIKDLKVRGAWVGAA